MSREATARADELIGSVVDNRYKVLEAMAAGSMGAVYRAEREPVGKIVAIKFLHASYANDAEFLGRFERETRVMSKLAHPNCVSVVDFGVWEGAPYLVMEYVHGKTIRTLLDQGGAMAVPRALGIARQIAAGLAHAHAQGITHRDIKPANIMLSEEIGAGEHVRILDFGLARLRGAVGRDATQSNVVVGTPNYMAPEQTVGGGIIDARTDIYAVGVVLFELIAGERPFQAEDTLALLGMHRAAPIPKLADRVKKGTELPVGIQDVIEKAMAKVPGERYQSAIELARAIDEMLGVRASSSAETKVHVAPRKLDSMAVAPTEVAIDDSERIEKSTAWHRPSRAGIYLVVAVLLAGVITAAYIKSRDDKAIAAHQPGSGSVKTGNPLIKPDAGVTSAPPQGSGSSGSAAINAAGSAITAAGSAITAAGSGLTPATIDAGAVSETTPPIDAAPETPEPGAGSDETSATLPEGVGGADEPPASGSATETEVVPDPTKATNPAQTSATVPKNEDPNEPATHADIEKRATPTTTLATSIEGAVALIKKGERETALASLRNLWTKNPNSAYIPFLLGNLYFDKGWWSVSLDHYRAAIGRHGGYRSNSVLVRNVIQMLSSKKTSGKAEFFIRRTIGRNASLGHLQWAGRNDPNPTVRRYASALARQMR